MSSDYREDVCSLSNGVFRVVWPREVTARDRDLMIRLLDLRLAWLREELGKPGDEAPPAEEAPRL